MADYPNSITALFSNKTDGVDDNSSSDVNSMKDEIIAIETELGANVSGSSSDVAARFTALEGSKLSAASSSDVDAYTSGTLGITPAALGAAMAGMRGMLWQVLDDTTAPTTDDPLGGFSLTVPPLIDNWYINAVYFSHQGTASTDITVYDLDKNGNSIFSTLPSIDADEKNSWDATTDGVVSDSDAQVSQGDLLTIAKSSGGASAAGLTLHIEFKPTS
jgi:hypothetical protein